MVNGKSIQKKIFPEKQTNIKCTLSWSKLSLTSINKLTEEDPLLQNKRSFKVPSFVIPGTIEIKTNTVYLHVFLTIYFQVAHQHLFHLGLSKHFSNIKLSTYVLCHLATL